jgi:transposase
MQRQRKELNFKGENIYVGIDVHLKSWYVAILTEYIEHKRFRLDPEAEILAKYLQTRFPGGTYYSVYEAGFSGFSAHYKLTALGIKNIVVNAADVPTSNKEQEQKSDPVDASKLARSLRNGELTCIHIHRPETLRDRSLMRTRSSLVKDMTRIKNRIKGMLYYYGVPVPPEFASKSNWPKRFVSWLETVKTDGLVSEASFGLYLEEYAQKRSQLLKAMLMIRELSRSEAYAENMAVLKHVHGIGITTGMFLLVNIEDISRFPSRDKFRGYLGLNPGCHQSGDKNPKGHLTQRGQGELRALLMESAWIAARKDPALTLKFNALCRRMDPSKAIVQIAGKLANRIYYVLKNKEKYVNAVVE